MYFLRSSLFIMAVFTCHIISGQIPGDSVLYARDSVIETEEDPTILFFNNGEKIASPGSTSIITKTGKRYTVASFLKMLSGSGSPDVNDTGHVLADLDKDGIKELLVRNFTGGAHCCDEIYVFRNLGVNKYQQVAKLHAGHTRINNDLEFTYSFDEHLGYFFTCYACSYADSTDAAPIPLRSIIISYKKGKMLVKQGDSELRSIINDNLSKLGELPYQPLDKELMMDEGLRKEIAMNLAVYYYSFGRNITATKALFNKYYKHPDALKIWNRFNNDIREIRADNNF